MCIITHSSEHVHQTNNGQHSYLHTDGSPRASISTIMISFFTTTEKYSISILAAAYTFQLAAAMVGGDKYRGQV